MKISICVLPGDGIGPEITSQAERVLQRVAARFGHDVDLTHALIGGAAIDATGVPLPQETIAACRASQAVLLGAVGGPRWDHLDPSIRPEKGLLGIRKELGLFANLRPAVLFPELAAASLLRPDIVASGIDVLVVRELTGGVYFGEPRGEKLDAGEQVAFNTMIYRESEIVRILRVAFAAARLRRRRVCSVDKANVLEVSRLWRAVAERVAQEYPDVELTHMYVDNAAMQLVRAPGQFDVVVTENLFGDILSDEAAAITGSLGMLPSASLGAGGPGLFEPIHGSAPDIAGRDVANPLATILSVAMLLRQGLGLEEEAQAVEAAVRSALASGVRTRDIAAPGDPVVGCRAMTDAVLAALG